MISSEDDFTFRLKIPKLGFGNTFASNALVCGAIGLSGFTLLLLVRITGTEQGVQFVALVTLTSRTALKHPVLDLICTFIISAVVLPGNLTVIEFVVLCGLVVATAHEGRVHR
jgi:hypothetical protein